MWLRAHFCNLWPVSWDIDFQEEVHIIWDSTLPIYRLQESYDSYRREVLFSILKEYGGIHDTS
jgi:hypothetical protein